MLRRLEPQFVERVWGRKSLRPLFGEFDRNIGEVWFADGKTDPLLVKFLFTSERLSVQVHPDDAYAHLHEHSCGKTEMWHVLAAEPGASIALGFKRSITREQLREAIDAGTVEDLLEWVPVQPGQTFYAPAGTVHAIGAGLVVCEIQQNSDVTYRLYDYGRPRELHLEKGLQVASTAPYDGQRDFPVACEHFVTDQLNVNEVAVSDLPCEYLLIGTEGSGSIAGEHFKAGEVWQVSAGHGSVEIVPDGAASLLRTRCATAEGVRAVSR